LWLCEPKPSFEIFLSWKYNKLMLPPPFNQLQLELPSKLAQMGTSKEYEGSIGMMF
jgi:hypothetical protein